MSELKRKLIAVSK